MMVDKRIPPEKVKNMTDEDIQERPVCECTTLNLNSLIVDEKTSGMIEKSKKQSKANFPLYK